MGRKYQNMKLPSSLIKGMIAGLITTLFVAVIVASLICVEAIGEETVDLGVMAATIIGSLICGLVAAGKTEKMRLVMCMAGCVAYYLVLLCCAAILFDGIKSGVGLGALLCVGGGLTAALLGAKKEKRSHYKLPKTRT